MQNQQQEKRERVVVLLRDRTKESTTGKSITVSEVDSLDGTNSHPHDRSSFLMVFNEEDGSWQVFARDLVVYVKKYYVE
jgi:hypothetical protein